MFTISQVTSDPNQSQTLILPDGTQIFISLFYSDQQFGWFFTEINYGSFILNGLRICNSPDLLYQFKNQIPFGIGCSTVGGREPTQLEDFASGASTLYLLTAADVAAYATSLQNG